MITGEWVPFSARYGISTRDVWADVPGYNRHTPAEPVTQHRCLCIGATQSQCIQRATQEDMRCDECRAHCIVRAVSS